MKDVKYTWKPNVTEVSSFLNNPYSDTVFYIVKKILIITKEL